MTESRTETDELPYWLALLRMPGVGPATAQILLERWHTPRQLFEAGAAGERDLHRLPDSAKDYLRQPDWSTVERDIAWIAQTGSHAVTLHDTDYPPLLKQIADPPLLLFVRGNLTLLAAPQIAVVGSRNPTTGGEQTAAEFAQSLTGVGLAITSGMAVGIDAAAHRGALAGNGHTIAVAGTGLDRVYPARHRELAREIAERGTLISEFPPGTPPRPEHFPRRNRLISGLSLGTLVVEAATQSGSLITARLATEQGREVFAIPGSIHNPLARGCHALIRQGAKLVETAQDILEELGALAAWSTTLAPASATTVPTEDDPEEFLGLLQHVGFEPTAIDLLIERSGLTANQVSSMLVVLELHGRVASEPGGLYTRIH